MRIPGNEQERVLWLSSKEGQSRVRAPVDVVMGTALIFPRALADERALVNETNPEDIQPLVLGEYFQKDHFEKVVALLRAMNVKSSVSFNGMIYGVQVEITDGRRCVWSNYEGGVWACTVVEADGSVTNVTSAMVSKAPPEAVAHTIAYAEYGGIEV